MNLPEAIQDIQSKLDGYINHIEDMAKIEKINDEIAWDIINMFVDAKVALNIANNLIKNYIKNEN